MELGVLTGSVLFVEQVTTVFRQVLWEGASYRSIPSFLHVIVQAGAEPMSRVHRTLEQTNQLIVAHSTQLVRQWVLQVYLLLEPAGGMIGFNPSCALWASRW